LDLKKYEKNITLLINMLLGRLKHREYEHGSEGFDRILRACNGFYVA
jgi:hypothetical protein